MILKIAMYDKYCSRSRRGRHHLDKLKRFNFTTVFPRNFVKPLDILYTSCPANCIPFIFIFDHLKVEFFKKNPFKNQNQ